MENPRLAASLFTTDFYTLLMEETKAMWTVYKFLSSCLNLRPIFTTKTTSVPDFAPEITQNQINKHLHNNHPFFFLQEPIVMVQLDFK